MATWTADYYNDLGAVAVKAALTVYGSIEGVRQVTSADFDSQYLPPVAVSAFTRTTPLCTIASGTRTIRTALCTISSTEMVHIPCPWNASQAEFLAFWQHLATNSSFLLVQMQGETINDWYTRLYAT